MPLTYGGVNLCQPTRVVLDWIANNVTLESLYEFQSINWPGHQRQAWAFPGRPADRPIQINTLFWPTGASRWSVFHGLVTDNLLSKIRPKAETSAGLVALPLLLDDGKEQISAPMFMLPPRPLAQRKGTNGLYLLTCVDQRYFFWEKSAAIKQRDGTTLTAPKLTWSGMFKSVADALGVTIAVDAIDPVYLSPSSNLSAEYQFLPLLLDALAYNVGHRIVVNLDGTISTQSATTAKQIQDQQIDSAVRKAGGKFALTNIQPTDLNGVLPQNVMVAFPETINGVPQEAPFTINVSLASLALPEVPTSITGHAGTKIYRDVAVHRRLQIVPPPSLDKTNPLKNLTKQIATDFYRWRLGRQNSVYAGLVLYPPEGLSDYIEWRYARPADNIPTDPFPYQRDNCRTTVVRGPFNDLIETLSHADPVWGSLVEIQPGVFSDLNAFVPEQVEVITPKARPQNIALSLAHLDKNPLGFYNGRLVLPVPSPTIQYVSLLNVYAWDLSGEHGLPVVHQTYLCDYVGRARDGTDTYAFNSFPGPQTLNFRHALLSPTHFDTEPYTPPVKGDLVVGTEQAGPVQYQVSQLHRNSLSYSVSLDPLPVIGNKVLVAIMATWGPNIPGPIPPVVSDNQGNLQYSLDNFSVNQNVFCGIYSQAVTAILNPALPWTITANFSNAIQADMLALELWNGGDIDQASPAAQGGGTQPYVTFGSSQTTDYILAVMVNSDASMTLISGPAGFLDLQTEGNGTDYAAGQIVNELVVPPPLLQWKISPAPTHWAAVAVAYKIAPLVPYQALWQRFKLGPVKGLFLRVEPSLAAGMQWEHGIGLMDGSASNVVTNITNVTLTLNTNSQNYSNVLFNSYPTYLNQWLFIKQFLALGYTTVPASVIAQGGTIDIGYTSKWYAVPNSAGPPIQRLAHCIEGQLLWIYNDEKSGVPMIFADRAGGPCDFGFPSGWNFSLYPGNERCFECINGRYHLVGPDIFVPAINASPHAVYQPTTGIVPAPYADSVLRYLSSIPTNANDPTSAWRDIKVPTCPDGLISQKTFVETLGCVPDPITGLSYITVYPATELLYYQNGCVRSQISAGVPYTAGCCDCGAGVSPPPPCPYYCIQCLDANHNPTGNPKCVQWTWNGTICVPPTNPCTGSGGNCAYTVSEICDIGVGPEHTTVSLTLTSAAHGSSSDSGSGADENITLATELVDVAASDSFTAAWSLTQHGSGTIDVVVRNTDNAKAVTLTYPGGTIVLQPTGSFEFTAAAISITSPLTGSVAFSVTCSGTTTTPTNWEVIGPAWQDPNCGNQCKPCPYVCVQCLSASGQPYNNPICLQEIWINGKCDVPPTTCPIAGPTGYVLIGQPGTDPNCGGICTPPACNWACYWCIDPATGGTNGLSQCIQLEPDGFGNCIFPTSACPSGLVPLLDSGFTSQVNCAANCGQCPWYCVQCLDSSGNPSGNPSCQQFTLVDGVCQLPVGVCQTVAPPQYYCVYPAGGNPSQASCQPFTSYPDPSKWITTGPAYKDSDTCNSSCPGSNSSVCCATIPNSWTVVISGCTGVFAIANGTWTLTPSGAMPGEVWTVRINGSDGSVATITLTIDCSPKGEPGGFSEIIVDVQVTGPHNNYEASAEWHVAVQADPMNCCAAYTVPATNNNTCNNGCCQGCSLGTVPLTITASGNCTGTPPLYTVIRKDNPRQNYITIGPAWPSQALCSCPAQPYFCIQCLDANGVVQSASCEPAVLDKNGNWVSPCAQDPTIKCLQAEIAPTAPCQCVQTPAFGWIACPPGADRTECAPCTSSCCPAGQTPKVTRYANKATCDANCGGGGVTTGCCPNVSVSQTLTMTFMGCRRTGVLDGTTITFNWDGFVNGWTADVRTSLFGVWTLQCLLESGQWVWVLTNTDFLLGYINPTSANCGPPLTLVYNPFNVPGCQLTITG